MIPLDNPPEFLLFMGLVMWLLLPFVMGKAWLSTWRESVMPNWLLLLGPMFLQTILTIFYNNDLALIQAYQSDGGATLPYGRAWFLLNPFYGQSYYLWYILPWNFAFLGIMYFLVRRGRLPLTWVYWCEVLNVILILVHNPQSIVPMSFVYLVPAFTPLVLGVAAAIKLPVGWSFSISANRHWQCAFSQVAPANAPYWECLHFSPSYFLHSMDAWYNFSVYIILGGWILNSVWTWKAGRTPRKLAFDFLNASHLAPLVIRFMQATGLYERRVRRLIETLHGSVAVDVGANDGYYTRLLEKTFHDVYPIDPNPKYKNCLHVALSDSNRTSKFFFDKNSTRAGSLLQGFTYRNAVYSGSQSIFVRVMRFDNLSIASRLHIDFVKIDVEGAEFEVIKGMGDANVDKILVELHDEARDLELVALLSLKEFTVTRIDRNHFFAQRF